MTCLRGASAFDSVLKRHGGAPVSVFAIWHPILATDRLGPARWALNTLPDRRVRQYWDAERLVASRMIADARPPQPELECCRRDDTIWDVAAVYRPGDTWTDKLPTAVVFNGSVADIASEIDAAIAASSQPQPEKTVQ